MAREPAGRSQVVEGAIETIRQHGLAGFSLGSAARAAGVAEEVVTEHFAGRYELLAEVGRVAVQAGVDTFRERFGGLTGLRELLDAGREMWAQERVRRNVVVLGQLLAAAQSDPRLAEVTGPAMQPWVEEVERVIRRLIADSPFTDLVNPAETARAVCAGFVGLSLFGPAGNGVSPFDVLEPLAGVAEELKPFERRVLYARLRAHNDRRR